MPPGGDDRLVAPQAWQTPTGKGVQPMNLRGTFGGMVLIVGMIAIGSYANAAPSAPESLPISDVSAQLAFENELATFLASNPAPTQDDYAPDVEGQNQYWQAIAAWWTEVPWDAVAGQWGCVNTGSSVSFNPIDEAGIISAGYGGSGSCGGVEVHDSAIIFAVPETRTTQTR